MTATSVMILAPSGFGKSRSLINMNPETTLLIKTTDKRLPFPGAEKWKLFDDKDKTGNVIVTDNSEKICALMRSIGASTKRDKIVIDDAQFIMSNHLMREGANKKGSGMFDEYNQIAREIWQIMQTANSLPDHVRVYANWHPDIEEDGRWVAKTVGKLTAKVNDPPSYFPIVFVGEVSRAPNEPAKYKWRTQSNGLDPAKSPEGMFDYLIDNDMEMVDKRICEYWNIPRK